MSALGPSLGSRPREQQQERPGYAARETVLVLTAALVFIDGLIHIGAAVDHFEEFHLYAAAFGVLAAVQIAWAAMLARQPSRRVLLAGCAFSAGVIAMWATSRTVGVPIAPQPWRPEPVGVADLVETLGETVTVVAVLSVALSPKLRGTERAIRLMPGVLLCVLFASVLFGVAAHAG
ncbi:MAG TPA: hypothetical protein VGX51_14330 [Solirubrobacteraceae bacterium]|nr:hypothetical protein [Solirubrobacteraceae bacterium]